MKKVLFVILCMLTVGLVNLNAGEPVDMNAGGTDAPSHPVSEKTPIVVPTISIDGYTLFLDGLNTDYTLELIDENDTVVYSTFVPSTVSVVVLPSTLSGNYELRLYPGGSYYFYGYISL